MRISPRRSLKKALAELSSPRRVVSRSSFGSNASISVGELQKGDELNTQSLSSGPSQHVAATAAPSVRFNEQANEYHPPLHEVDVEQQWYSSQDSASFRKECSKLARLMTASEESSTHDTEKWSDKLLSAYQGFCKADTADQVMQVFESSKVKIPQGALGLDSWVVRAIHYDRVERRRSLVSQLAALQLSTPEGSARVSKMAKFSRALSRPSRLYAHHLGLLVAGDVEEEEFLQQTTSTQY